jgi:molybdopterin synthase catalytic subunit
MKLTVHLFAGLRERAGADALELDELPERLSIGELKAELARRRPELGDLTHVAGVVGTDWADDARALLPGDQLSLLPPVSGGEPRPGGGGPAADFARGVFELAPEPIDEAEAGLRVHDDSCGALVVFSGRTRRTSRGREVVRLEYEAFESMAAPEMERIFERSRLLLLDEERVRMLVRHRVGVVEVGETSVVVAVASPHRDAAFRVARFLIDDLKRSLPVWKKEVYADGHVWVGEHS